MKTPDAEILVRLAEKRLRIHGLTIDQYTLVAEQFARAIEMFYQSENWIRAGQTCERNGDILYELKDKYEAKNRRML